MFSVTTPATDRTLLTIADLRSAAGLEPDDRSKDVALRDLEKQIASVIASSCRLATDGTVPPTLRVETLTDVFRTHASGYISRHHVGRSPNLVLSRTPVVSVASVTENDTPLDPSTDYLIRKTAGMLVRMSSDCEICWPCGKITVVYDAGWAVVRDDLRFAAKRFVELVTGQAGRDPLLRRETNPGVYEREWWVEPKREVSIPPEVLDLLSSAGYVNEWIG